MLKASRVYHCECTEECNAVINPGDSFYIIKGTFFKEGHPKKQIAKPEPKKKMVLKKG